MTRAWPPTWLRRSPAWRWLPWLLLLAAGVRAWQLTFHSLWLDEVFSLFWASKPAGDIVRVGLTLTEDKHPPLYYLLLHGWIGLFGATDAAVRSLGVFLGALAVWPVYGLGLITQPAPADRPDHAWRRGALPALLLALNPFLVWYSQEARMFMPATTFGLWGLYAWLRALAPTATRGLTAPGRKIAPFFWYGLAIGGLLAACYSYLFAAFLLPVAGLWWLVEKFPTRPAADRGQNGHVSLAALCPGALALTIMALLFLPLALAAWSVSGAEAAPGRPFADLWPTLAHLLTVYTLRQAPWSPPLIGIATAGAGGLLLIGLAAGVRQDGRRGLFLLTWLAVPLLLGNFLLAKDATVFAETRYFIFLVPALCLAWARGLQALAQWRLWPGRAATVSFLLLCLAALPSVWRADPAWLREDWRTAGQVVSRYVKPGDVVLNHVNYTQMAFARYYRGAAPLQAPFGSPLADESAVEAQLDPLTTADTLWLVLSHQEGVDPANLARAWLGGRFPLATELYPAGIAIRAYATRYRLTGLPATAVAVDGPAQVGGAVRLAGCTLEPGPVTAAQQMLHPPSGWAHVTLYWQALAAPARERLARVRLLDADGQVWGESLERADSALHFYPMTAWQPGEWVRDDYDINLNPATPTGVYRVAVTLLEEEAEVICGHVTVTK